MSVSPAAFHFNHIHFLQRDLWCYCRLHVKHGLAPFIVRLVRAGRRESIEKMDMRETQVPLVNVLRTCQQLIRHRLIRIV